MHLWRIYIYRECWRLSMLMKSNVDLIALTMLSYYIILVSCSVCCCLSLSIWFWCLINIGVTNNTTWQWHTITTYILLYYLFRKSFIVDKIQKCGSSTTLQSAYIILALYTRSLRNYSSLIRFRVIYCRYEIIWFFPWKWMRTIFT